MAIVSVDTNMLLLPGTAVANATIAKLAISVSEGDAAQPFSGELGLTGVWGEVGVAGAPRQYSPQSHAQSQE